MSLLSDAVGLIDGVTGSLGFQANVQLGTDKGDDGVGDPTWKIKTRAAVIEYKVRQVTDAEGRVVASKMTVTFLKPNVAVNVGDQITYKGQTNTVISVSSPVDITGRLITTAYL